MEVFGFVLEIIVNFWCKCFFDGFLFKLVIISSFLFVFNLYIFYLGFIVEFFKFFLVVMIFLLKEKIWFFFVKGKENMRKI